MAIKLQSIKYDEEYHHLIKVKVFHTQGTSHWLMKAESRLNGEPITGKGEFTFIGTVSEFANYLKRIKAKDNASSPASARNKTYMTIASEIEQGVDPYIWIWNDKWERNFKPYRLQQHQQSSKPTEYIKEKSNININEIPKGSYKGSKSKLSGLWKKAKDVTADTFGISVDREGDWTDRYYKYAVEVFDSMVDEHRKEAKENLAMMGMGMGIEGENIMNKQDIVNSFLESTLTGDDFIEQVVSGDFNIGTVTTNKELDDQEKEDYLGIEYPNDVSTEPGEGINTGLDITRDKDNTDHM